MEKTKTKSAVKTENFTSSLTKNIIQFRNGFVNLLPASKDSENVNATMSAINYQTAMSVVSELMQFGFILDESAISNLKNASKKDIISFHDEVISYLKDLTGSKTKHQPFWHGFPLEVMEKSEIELWLHQIVHYMSNGTYIPNQWTKERATAFEQPNYKTITAGDENKFLNIFKNLVSVNQSLTPEDLDIVKWYVSNGVELRMPEIIPFKENLCTLASMGLNVPIKSVTDVLRICVGMSGGDISLPKVPRKFIKMNRWSSEKSENPARANFKFKKFTRKERKLILTLLEKTNCDSSEAVLKSQRWIRLGEILHPGEYKNKFPRAFKMFDDLRNKKVVSWYGKVNIAFEKSFEKGLTVLSERAGELFRRIDWLIRTNGAVRRKLTLETIKEVAPKVSNKVLYEIYTHFEKRLSPTHDRSIMVKGSRKRTKLKELEAIDEKTVAAIQEVVINALKEKFAKLPVMGKVWLDEELKKVPLPTNMRSVSTSLRPIIRGTRMPIGNQSAVCIRAFIHWLDEHGNEDLDLTATLIGMGKIKKIGWNGEHNCNEGQYSGDVRRRIGNCAEFIDINLKNALKSGFKYAILDVRNYQGRGLDTVKDCVCGFMERQYPEANELFIPATLANTIKLMSISPNTIINMIDLETQEFIMIDLDSEGIPVASHDFENIMNAIKPYMEPPKFSVFNLLELHIESRGGKIVKKEDADIKFEFDEFSSSYVKTLEYMGV